jgi:hypothetical protein
MKKVLIAIAAVIAGVIAGSIAISLVEWIGHKMYPVMDSIDPANQEALKTIIASLPIGALLMILLGWAIGALVAGMVTTLIIRQNALRPALYAGGVLMAAGIINLFLIPSPVWFMVATVLLFLPAAWLGHKLVARK